MPRHTRPDRRPRRPLRARRDSVLQPHDEFTGLRSEFRYLAPHTSEITGNVLFRDVRAQKGSWDEPGYHGPLPTQDELEFIPDVPDERYT